MWEYEVVFEGGVLITPRGKGRPRFTRSGHAFTDPKTREYEAFLKNSFRHGYKGPVVPRETPIGLKIVLNVPQIKKPVRVMPTVKPDLDNAAKSILDALNGVVFEDDSQVCKLEVEKRYAAEGFIELKVYLLDVIRKQVL
jgi:Holliday junction resolvase RusA-like endonuclease